MKIVRQRLRKMTDTAPTTLGAIQAENQVNLSQRVGHIGQGRIDKGTYRPKGRPRDSSLKGLSYEIDFENVDEN